MNILFRTDSSSIIGTGHIMRDLVLAKEFKYDDIFFAVRELSGNINCMIEKSNYKIRILKSNDISELDLVIKKLNIKFLVIDHYQINHKFEHKLRELNPKLKIMVLDDTYEKHNCDILLNHNIYADKSKYKGLIPSKCELRCGGNYTLIREEFYKERTKTIDKSLKKKIEKNIFLAMGGSDHTNINIKILKKLKEIKKVKVNVVTTLANKNLESLKKYCKNKKWIRLYINSDEIAKLMKKSDFAIVTPSVTVNEVYFMDLPFIAIMTASNQRYMYKYLKKRNFLVMKSFSSKLMINFINKISKRIY